MLRASVKGVLARPGRLALSTIAVLLAVAFTTGSLIFTDALSRSFTAATAGATGEVVVRPEGASASVLGASSGATIPASVVSTVAATPGVSRADGVVLSYSTFIVGKDRKVVGTQGAPGIGINATPANSLAGVPVLAVVRGSLPKAAGEVALDRASAAASGYVLGELVPVLTTENTTPTMLKLVGTVRLGEGTVAGGTVTVLTTPMARQLLLSGKNAFSEIWVTPQDGVAPEAVVASLKPLLPKGIEVLTGEEASAQSATVVQSGVGFLSTFLLIFAGVAVLVGAFLVLNTFAIVVAQRGRELALFRALGASRRQTTTAILLESLLIGIVGSGIGVLLGMGLAWGIRAAVTAMGIDLSEVTLRVPARALLAGFGLGIGMTLLAALAPARRAGSVPPIAALRDTAAGGHRARTARTRVAGAVLLVVGAVALAVPFLIDLGSRLPWIGAGAAFVLLGLVLLLELLGRPILGVVAGIAGRVFGMVGRLAQLNAQRDPSRLTTTAASMMVGVALVSAVSIMGSSASASVDAIIKRTFTADVVVSNLVGTPFSGKVAAGVAGVPGVTTTSRLRVTQATSATGSSFVAGIDPATYEEVTHVVVEGTRPSGLKDGEVLVANTRAQADGLVLGSRVSLTFGSLTERFRVAGIFEGTPALPAPYVVTLSEFDKAGIAANDSMVFARLAPGTDRDAAMLRIGKVVKDLPTITVKDDAAFAAQQRAPIDRLLGLVNALLALSLLIALLGIVNTLTLSVSERVREIGLLRAVGLGRAQVARMIRLEAAVVALLGACVGLLSGVALGVLIQRLLVSEGMNVLSIPWPLLAVVLVLAGLAGVLAAVRPGKKAAGMEIIAALRTD